MNMLIMGDYDFNVLWMDDYANNDYMNGWLFPNLVLLMFTDMIIMGWLWL